MFFKGGCKIARIYPIHKITYILIRNSVTAQIDNPLSIHFEQVCMVPGYQWDPTGELFSRTIGICQRMGDFPIIPASLVLNKFAKLKDSIKFYHDDHICAVRISIPDKRNFFLNNFFVVYFPY